MPDAVEVDDVVADVPPQYEAPDIESILDAEVPEAVDEPVLAAEVPAPEPPVVPAGVPAPATQPQDDRVNEGLKALMDRERELQAARRQLDEERAALEPLRRYQDLERRLKEEDAEGALQELGVKLDDVNRAVVEGRGTQAHGKLQREIQAKLEAIQAQTQERMGRLEQMEIQRLQQETQAEVRTAIAPDRFPMVAAVGDFGIQAVLAKSQEHFKRSGQVPSYDQVIGDVEAELGKFADQLMKSDAVRARYLSQATSEVKRTPSPTLGNGHAAAVSKRKPATKNEIDLSTLDDREDAIEALLAGE